MSIIEDALRRVQDPVVTSNAPPAAKAAAPAAPAPAAAPLPKAQSKPAKTAPAPAHSWSTEAPAEALPLKARAVQEAPLFMAVVVLGLTGILAIAAAFWMGRRLHPPAAPAAAVVPVPEGSPSANALNETVAAVPLAQGILAPAFSLSGIVEGLGQPCAMINAAIVCLGERVSGGQAKLVDVGDRMVTLEQPDGSTLTLKLPR